MSQAPAEFMRYDEMEQWLRTCGLSVCEIRSMVREGLIKGVTFTSKRKRWYHAGQIAKDVLGEKK
jgi:hypothetical protein